MDGARTVTPAANSLARDPNRKVGLRRLPEIGCSERIAELVSFYG